jgi:hypothetical protein
MCAFQISELVIDYINLKTTKPRQTPDANLKNVQYNSGEFFDTHFF